MKNIRIRVWGPCLALILTCVGIGLLVSRKPAVPVQTAAQEVVVKKKVVRQSRHAETVTEAASTPQANIQLELELDLGTLVKVPQQKLAVNTEKTENTEKN